MRLFAAILSLLAPSSGAAATYVIAAGNNVGEQDEPELRFAERDATRLAEALTRIGAEQPVLPQLLLSSTAPALTQAIGDVASRLHRDDVLIVFFSGHADADGLHLRRTVLPFDALKTQIERSPARVKLLIVDACRSGSITHTKGAEASTEFAIEIEDRLGVEGMVIVTSSAESEESQESDQLRGSFFTHHLVNGLLGAADEDRNLRVTLHEAYAYAYGETLRSTGRTRSLQHPTYSYDLSGRGDLVLTQISSNRKYGVVGFVEPGAYLVFDDDDALLAELRVGEEGARYLLPEGRWLLQKREGSGARERRVEVRKGEELAFVASNSDLVSLTRLAAKGRADDGRADRVVLMGGAHGPVVTGYGAAPAIFAGYRHSFTHFDLGGEVRFARDGGSHQALGLRAKIERGFDFGFASFGGGLVLEGTFHRQREGERIATQLYGGIGLLAFSEIKIFGPLMLRLEGGPTVHFLKRETAEDRVELGAPIAWWMAGGPTWGF